DRFALRFIDTRNQIGTVYVDLHHSISYSEARRTAKSSATPSAYSIVYDGMACNGPTAKAGIAWITRRTSARLVAAISVGRDTGGVNCQPPSHQPRHRRQKTRPFPVGGFDRLLGAEHDHAAARRDGRHGVGKPADVSRSRRENLFAHALARLLGVADQIVLH